MVSKAEKNKKINELYARVREEVCYRYNIVNVSKARKHQEELSNLEEYLPILMPSFIMQEYSSLNEKGLWDDIVKRTGETRKYSHEECIYEFVDWIDNHQEFEELLNRNELKNLERKLNDLEKTFDKTFKCLT
jgi:hypothetical protein